ncbi:hypothetical protein CVO74_00200 [Xanthomonas prunicola]|uniref:Uncharacterized protein n=1 Tax=Xanthomonas prunicola TaxID=2053930 RepID=A0A2N3RQA4_9XANT|nr:hypothetical protein XpruCFBP8353_06255 [Xanthomonas prunicola]PKV18912.1 hypothetical protein XpruCFBP8354_06255 [Xanthomonas prunicola]PKV21777.1 hypothetical protein CVO74_00200 [Xanthomonas prunicola]
MAWSWQRPADASVTAFSPTTPCGGQLHGSIAGRVLACRQPHTAGVRAATTQRPRYSPACAAASAASLAWRAASRRCAGSPS